MISQSLQNVTKARIDTWKNPVEKPKPKEINIYGRHVLTTGYSSETFPYILPVENSLDYDPEKDYGNPYISRLCTLHLVEVDLWLQIYLNT